MNDRKAFALAILQCEVITDEIGKIAGTGNIEKCRELLRDHYEATRIRLEIGEELRKVGYFG